MCFILWVFIIVLPKFLIVESVRYRPMLLNIAPWDKRKCPKFGSGMFVTCAKAVVLRAHMSMVIRVFIV